MRQKRESKDTWFKENIKKTFLRQNIPEIWNTMKRPNLTITGIEEEEESQIYSAENIFNKTVEFLT